MGRVAFRAKSGSVTVTLDDTLERVAKQAVELALGEARTEMLKGMQEIADAAVDEWPVGKQPKPVHSRDGITLVEEIDLNLSRYTVRILNPVPWAPYVRPSKWYGATTAWQRLVRGPVDKLKKELVDTIGPKLTAAIQKGVK